MEIKNDVKNFICGLGLTIILISFASGQTIILTGTVYDPNRAIVVGVYVKAASDDKKPLLTRSAEDGTFEFELGPGVYSLQFTHFGFKTTVVDEIVVDAISATKKLDTIMTPAEDIEPCGYGGHCQFGGDVIEIEKSVPSDKITLRPIIEGPKKTKTKTIKRKKRVSRKAVIRLT